MKEKAKIDLDMCIVRISKGDRDALEMLYKELCNPVFRFALMILKEYSLAEDAMQETFVKIMANANSYRPHTNPRAWIFSIARNTCMDIFNSKKKTPSTDDTVLNLITDNMDLTEIISVREAVEKLTEREREILSLYIFGGLKQTEIAKVLSIPYNKVRAHYGYAIQKLRKELR